MSDFLIASFVLSPPCTVIVFGSPCVSRSRCLVSSNNSYVGVRDYKQGILVTLHCRQRNWSFFSQFDIYIARSRKFFPSTVDLISPFFNNLQLISVLLSVLLHITH